MNELKAYAAVAAVFGFLSIQAVGGGPAVLPEMQRSVVSTFHLAPDQFVQAYGLGQLVPGPNMLLVVVLGYRVAGVVGAVIALLAFFIPMSIVVVLVGRYITHLPASPWKHAVRDGLAPVTIGLMASGAYAMGRAAITTLPSILIGAVVVGLMLGTKINPIWLVLASAAAGAILLPH
ncbi:MAG TPA: chromate transporter [Candidatus Baltobacteraceae bacterium]|jgi:chromate transporter|nr:chromate transporter [Candidatus Baltobacteraceae bacterium]